MVWLYSITFVTIAAFNLKFVSCDIALSIGEIQACMTELHNWTKTFVPQIADFLSENEKQLHEIRK